MSPPSESTSSSTMVVVALILARSENSARLKCHRQTHTTNFLHFTCRAKPCVSLQSAPLLAVEMAAAAAAHGARLVWGKLASMAATMSNSIFLPVAMPLQRQHRNWNFLLYWSYYWVPIPTTSFFPLDQSKQSWAAALSPSTRLES